ncbi:MAG TPA: metallophosphoesterase [Gemmataceae bacterium]|nr:metallophosphoesterase [Gemmataceae bacterium]
MSIRWSEDWLLLPQRFALHVPSATAVLADIHLGYTAARQRLGDAIPSRSVDDEMQPLTQAAAMHDIRALVVAGDLFERRFEPDLWQRWLDLLARLEIWVAGVVPGNHDRGIEAIGSDLLHPAGYALAGWQIVHGDTSTRQARTISGHWHPALRHPRRKVPCFLARGQHLVLPAFSLDAAGMDVDAEPRWRAWQRIAVESIKLRESVTSLPEAPDE